MIRRLAHDVLEHPRLGRLRVSTIAWDQPQSYEIAAAPEMAYIAETIIWSGSKGEEMRDLIRYRSEEQALAEHARIVARSGRRMETKA